MVGWRTASSLGASLLLACSEDPLAVEVGEQDAGEDHGEGVEACSRPDPGPTRDGHAGIQGLGIHGLADPRAGCERHAVVEPAVLVVLPDTQLYARDYPDVFTSQTAWIADNAGALNIRHVFHLGDVVNDNTVVEWGRARAAMALLDGVVPYLVVPGNHDYMHREKLMTRVTPLSQWFTYAEARARPGFGGAYEIGRTENTFHLFSAGGHEWIVLALEWGPRDRVVAWADDVMAQHDDRLGILVTHAYLNHDDRRYDHTDRRHSQAFNPHNYSLAGGVNDGEQLWSKLVRRHRFVMTFSGHVLGDGAGYLVSRTDLGNTCHQMLSNYQMRTMGGEGYLRLLELHPDGRTIDVRTFSPTLDSYIEDADHDFRFELDLGAREDPPIP